MQAIAADQWLLLDEANRADLDRIFGGMLTWLAGQEVTVGRESRGSPSEIVLTWSRRPESSVEKVAPLATSPAPRSTAQARNGACLGPTTPSTRIGFSAWDWPWAADSLKFQFRPLRPTSSGRSSGSG